MNCVQEENLADELDKAKSRLDVMSAEIVSLSARLKEMEEEDRGKDTQLKEMKNMNAALENQLTEYMDALDHQNQVKTILRIVLLLVQCPILPLLL